MAESQSPIPSSNNASNTNNQQVGDNNNNNNSLPVLQQVLPSSSTSPPIGACVTSVPTSNHHEHDSSNDLHQMIGESTAAPSSSSSSSDDPTTIIVSRTSISSSSLTTTTPKHGNFGNGRNKTTIQSSSPPPPSDIVVGSSSLIAKAAPAAAAAESAATSDDAAVSARQSHNATLQHSPPSEPTMRQTKIITKSLLRRNTSNTSSSSMNNNNNNVHNNSGTPTNTSFSPFGRLRTIIGATTTGSSAATPPPPLPSLVSSSATTVPLPPSFVSSSSATKTSQYNKNTSIQNNNNNNNTDDDDGRTIKSSNNNENTEQEFETQQQKQQEQQIIEEEEMNKSTNKANRQMICDCSLSSSIILKPVSKCPLFGCFYAEFDNIVGPKLLHQCPPGFMEQDIHIPISTFENILLQTFQQLQPQQPSQQPPMKNSQEQQQQQQKQSNTTDGITNNKTNETATDTAPDARVNTITSNSISDDTTLTINHAVEAKITTSGTTTNSIETVTNTILKPEMKSSLPPTIPTMTFTTSTVASVIDNSSNSISNKRDGNNSRHRRVASGDSASSWNSMSKRSSDSNGNHKVTHRRVLSSDSNASGRSSRIINGGKERGELSNNASTNATITSTASTAPLFALLQQQQQSDSYQVSTHGSSSSIFDSCSEYIITGHELTGSIVSLSTHHIHVLTRPTVIFDATRYERNSLLFCVGFVLRRSTDPRPFRTVLSKLALLLRDMEMESQFLSKAKTMIIPTTSSSTANNNYNTPSSGDDKNYLQELLEKVFLSLNSIQEECNLILNHGTGALNLKLFHPPKIPAEPVKDYAVPIILRRDWHLQSYDWDLAINWVSLHIDGILNAKQISQKAEVDMEMVRACLRVLKHHGVIALVDMFFYSNRYECTDEATAMFAGGKDTSSKLLQDAVEFVIRGRGMSSSASVANTDGPGSVSGAGGADQHHHLPHNVPSSPIFTLSNSPINRMFYGSPSSCQLIAGSYRMNNLSLSNQSNQCMPMFASDEWRSDYAEVKSAVAELYCACHRGISIGDVLLSLVSNTYNTANSDKNAPYHHQIVESIDWKKICRLIDHRRFTTFGVVHGLLKRVHDYPMLLDDYYSDAFVSQLDMPRENVSHVEKAAAGNPILSPQRQQQNKSYRHNKTSNSTNVTGSEENKNIQNNEEIRRLTHQIAAMMDGFHCDDEIVCAFDMPLARIFELVKAGGGEYSTNSAGNEQSRKRRIVSVFA